MNSFDVSALLWGGLLLQKCYVLLCVNSEQLKVLVTSHIISYICELANLHLDVQENVQPVELENLKRVFKWPGTQMVSDGYSTAVSVQTSGLKTGSFVFVSIVDLLTQYGKVLSTVNLTSSVDWFFVQGLTPRKMTEFAGRRQLCTCTSRNNLLSQDLMRCHYCLLPWACLMISRRHPLCTNLAATRRIIATKKHGKGIMNCTLPRLDKWSSSDAEYKGNCWNGVLSFQTCNEPSMLDQSTSATPTHHHRCRRHHHHCCDTGTLARHTPPAAAATDPIASPGMKLPWVHCCSLKICCHILQKELSEALVKLGTKHRSAFGRLVFYIFLHRDTSAFFAVQGCKTPKDQIELWIWEAASLFAQRCPFTLPAGDSFGPCQRICSHLFQLWKLERMLAVPHFITRRLMMTWTRW